MKPIGNFEQKQHINLSEEANEILEQTRCDFGENLTGFFNHVFAKYYAYADASIGQALRKRKQQLVQAVGCEKEKAHLEALLPIFHKQWEDELKKKAKSYPKKIARKIRLQNENYARLYPTEGKEIYYLEEELKYYNNRPSEYFKAVLEEFARKSPLEREKIFFRDDINKLEKCIQEKRLIKVETSAGTFKVRPYKILCDKEQQFHYLTGYSQKIGEKEWNCASFRISRMHGRFKPMLSESGRINKTEEEQIKNRIHSSGVQFLIAEPKEIIIALTKQGEENYKKQIHLRPRAEKISDELDEITGGHRYTFYCTEAQARFYFFKFGKDAKVISPPKLQQRFREDYEAAQAIYQRKNE